MRDVITQMCMCVIVSGSGVLRVRCARGIRFVSEYVCNVRVAVALPPPVRLRAQSVLPTRSGAFDSDLPRWASALSAPRPGIARMQRGYVAVTLFLRLVR